MLNEVLDYLNNYFPKPLNLYNSDSVMLSNNYVSYEFAVSATFTTNATIAGAFTDTYQVGEYIRIQGSRLNDGVYLISAIDATSITIDATLDITITTESVVSCVFTKLYIPKAFIAIIADIKTYDASASNGIKSEAQGDRSISYGGDSSWQSVYAKKLGRYKKLGWSNVVY